LTRALALASAQASIVSVALSLDRAYEFTLPTASLDGYLFRGVRTFLFLVVSREKNHKKAITQTYQRACVIILVLANFTRLSSVSFVKLAFCFIFAKNEEFARKDAVNFSGGKLPRRSQFRCFMLSHKDHASETSDILFLAKLSVLVLCKPQKPSL